MRAYSRSPRIHLSSSNCGRLETWKPWEVGAPLSHSIRDRSCWTLRAEVGELHLGLGNLHSDVITSLSYRRKTNLFHRRCHFVRTPFRPKRLQCILDKFINQFKVYHIIALIFRRQILHINIVVGKARKISRAHHHSGTAVAVCIGNLVIVGVGRGCR